MAGKKIVRFSEHDLQVFSIASGDRNPLHLSAAYASRTAYGQQVVFGALGCLACLGSVLEPDGKITRITADFQRPMFVDVDYRVESIESRDSTVIRLFDGSTPVLTTAVKFSPGDAIPSPKPHRAVFPLEAARLMRWSDLSSDLMMEGQYRSEPTALQELCHRWSLKLDLLVTEALLWSSYFVGMELPGESALFFRAVLDFHGAARSDLPLQFYVKVVNLNQSLAQVRTALKLSCAEQVVVSGQLTSFLRPELPLAHFLEDEQERTNALAGKVAVVVGASRGLGAALTIALAADGAQVIAVSRSELTWISDFPTALREQITHWQGDAGDPSALSKLTAQLAESFQLIDFLVCSAFPAIPALRLEPSAALRIQDYLRRATNLVLTPLCEFLPQLKRSGGCTVLISSAAVIDPVRDWPHYVAAKSAAESFCRVAPMQFPETRTLIVRPERLLTEMTNTPMGRKGATSPVSLARQISRRLQQPPRAGTCEIFELLGTDLKRDVHAEQMSEPSLK